MYIKDLITLLGEVAAVFPEAEMRIPDGHQKDGAPHYCSALSVGTIQNKETKEVDAIILGCETKKEFYVIAGQVTEVPVGKVIVDKKDPDWN